LWAYDAEWNKLDVKTSGGDKRPRTITGKAFDAIDPPQKFLLIDKITIDGKEYPIVIKKKGPANTTRPKQ
jgi:hypothetical protein